MQVNLREARTNLSRLVERARQGDEVIIARAGKPMVRLVRADFPATCTLGTATGRLRFEKRWDAPLDEEELREMFG